MNRKKLLLFILLLAFAVSLGYSYLRMPRQKTVEKLTYGPGAPAVAVRTKEVALLDDKKLHLELLDTESSRFTGFRRNIFRPIFHDDLKPIPLPPPPPPPPKSTAKATPAVGVQSPVEQHPAPAVEVPTYVRDMAAFTFLGFMKKDNRKTIFLSKSGEIFLVKRGDKIDRNKYEITNITDDVLTINVMAEGREIIIPLEENKSLSPTRP